MTGGDIALWTFAGIGAISTLCALGLMGLAWREASVIRHTDTEPEPPEWAYIDSRQDWPELAEWERDIRTPGALEEWLAEETR